MKPADVIHVAAAVGNTGLQVLIREGNDLEMVWTVEGHLPGVGPVQNPQPKRRVFGFFKYLGGIYHKHVCEMTTRRMESKIAQETV